MRVRHSRIIRHRTSRRHIPPSQCNRRLHIQKEVTVALQALVIRNDRKSRIRNIQHIGQLLIPLASSKRLVDSCRAASGLAIRVGIPSGA
jgi:hypothetical protein